MQDRFKFRLYDKAIGEMVYDVCVGFIKDSGKTDYWVCADTSCGQITYRGDRLKDIVLMQCTGLKDKNGKLIYEGDILKFKLLEDFAAFGTNEKYVEIIAPVIYEYGGFFIEQSENSIFLGQLPRSEIEVVGNIYENPELLENKQ